MKQKQKFLQSEGNSWLQRNINAAEKRRLPDDDPVLRELIALPAGSSGGGVFLYLSWKSAAVMDISLNG